MGIKSEDKFQLRLWIKTVSPAQRID